jgi:hypothetical protein
LRNQGFGCNSRRLHFSAHCFLATVCDKRRRTPRFCRGLFVSTAAVIIGAVIQRHPMTSDAARNADNTQTISVCRYKGIRKVSQGFGPVLHPDVDVFGGLADFGVAGQFLGLHDRRARPNQPGDVGVTPSRMKIGDAVRPFVGHVHTLEILLLHQPCLFSLEARKQRATTSQFHQPARAAPAPSHASSFPNPTSAASRADSPATAVTLRRAVRDDFS